ncbi:unnamed protein product [Didymodactylos carnosus]|uniref:Uncharacterized protein n=1 Tax=Didymodactylos carnosus TaxID=1234261 RepID=A0A815E6J6_9BILA|nr:unnamed protein product [Didymodactylos carnosus]CAF1366979.1 unnamed protein product [Didymodactylos carnosus]CAF4143666.1 unnamed protein product [Didymodactylos carnosus]CAF4176291.1 unnamed protein product [Didymodactylos carnosus]
MALPNATFPVVIVITIAAIILGIIGVSTDYWVSGVGSHAGVLSVILLFSSGILIAASLMTYLALENATGYSFVLMAIAQFLSFMAAMFVSYWMGHAYWAGGAAVGYTGL